MTHGISKRIVRDTDNNTRQPASTPLAVSIGPPSNSHSRRCCGGLGETVDEEVSQMRRGTPRSRIIDEARQIVPVTRLSPLHHYGVIVSARLRA
jgi:hypothetical protein